jgi:hypothetical protein
MCTTTCCPSTTFAARTGRTDAGGCQLPKGSAKHAINAMDHTGTVNLVACLVAGRIVGLLAARWEGLA